MEKLNFSEAGRLKHPRDYGKGDPIINPEEFGNTYVPRYINDILGTIYFPVFRKTTSQRFEKKGR